MSLNINPNYDANSSDNELYNTQIPSLSENANIQEALRMYHYGVGTGVPEINSQIQPQSVAGHLKNLQSSITVLEEKGPGSLFLSTAPTSPDNGFIWVDSTSAATVFDTGIPNVAFYQSTAPGTDLETGLIWINSDTNEMSVYSGTQWVQLSSGSGGASPTSGNSAETTLTGQATNAYASASDIFYFDLGLGSTPYGVSVNVTSGFTKNMVNVSIGKIGSPSMGEIEILRIINQDALTTTSVAKLMLPVQDSPVSMSYVDVHGAAAGDSVAYVIRNNSIDPISIDSMYASQISVQEIQ